MRREEDGVSTHTFEGVSSLTVKQGDITLEAQVENLTVEVVERYETVNSAYRAKLFKTDATYAIRHTKLVPNEAGHYMTIRKSLDKGMDVEHTARIRMDKFTVPLLEEARIAAGAPEDADVVTHVSDYGKDVTFVWQTK